MCDILNEIHNLLDPLCEAQISDKYPIIQINGRRIYGPPANWTDPEPPISAELFIKQIPKTMMEYDIIPLFERFGRIYEFRLMMDYNNLNRGYAYIRFSSEVEALRAMTVMNHYILSRNKSFIIKQSYNKCRLFVGNIPRNIDRSIIENTFREFFPDMESFVLHQKISEEKVFKNRGFAFIDFKDHKSALMAKQKCASSIVRLWERDIKIVWANPERNVDTETLNEVRTLFMRNVHLSVSETDILKHIMLHIDKILVKKISRNRELAFIEFVNRSAAQTILNKLQGVNLNGYNIQIQWAIPPSEKYLHSHRLSNFDTLFRLKCIANMWDPPIIIYGRIYSSRERQNIAVVMRKNDRIYSYFFEVNLCNSRNLHARVYETLIQIIDEEGDLPKLNYIIYLENDTAHIVGHVPDINAPFGMIGLDLPNVFPIHWEEIVELCSTIRTITIFNFSELHRLYEQTLEKKQLFNFIDNFIISNRIIIGCLDSDIFSQKLKYGLDNRHIVLAQCDLYTKTNFSFPYKSELIYPFRSLDHKGTVGNCKSVIYKSVSLMPINLFIGNYHIFANGVYFGFLLPQLQ